ncbi:MAG TPA: hypothetical protein VFK90_02330 [Anaeromyxobacter sp.]|nr:hypothetical protein [Anaeromyxobacter sp.]
MPRPAHATAAALAAVAVLASCSGGDSDAKRRLFSRDDAASRKEAPFDFERPGAALSFGADDVARRLGSFEWTAAVEWTVAREGDDARRVRSAERHRLKQSAGGDFETSAEVDPGLGPGSETGKEIVFTGGHTYARAKYAPFRERPTDRGRDARRFRDESFDLAASVVRLYGGTLTFTPAGDAAVLGRTARRFRIGLASGATPTAPPPRPAGAPAPDDDTRRRSRFLEGRVPAAADGELLLDAATGAPLRVRLAGAFTVKDEPAVRASVELLAQVKSLGGEVAAVAAPKNPLPDERKPAGVAAALDAAGLRKRGEEGKAGSEEPADEPNE